MKQRSPGATRRALTILATAAALAACGDSTAPAPTSYSVDIDVNGFWVIGDCEDTPGNDGEFVWQLVANHPADRRASHSEATANFPEADGQIVVGEGAYVLASYLLQLSDIPADRRDDVTLTILVTEHDPGGPDPDMDLRSHTAAILFAEGEEILGQVALGTSSACQVLWDYGVTWSTS